VTGLHPFLAVADVDAAVAYYGEAFGAVEVAERVRAPNGLQVAELEIDGRRFGLSTEQPENRTISPEAAGGTTVRISLEVDDPDAVAERAVAAGGETMFPVADQPYGMRQGRVVDPFGHHWLIGKRLQ
jgi:PhnB protein